MNHTLSDSTTFCFCPICGNFAEMITFSGRPPICCGKEMQILIPGSSDGAAEKHVPVCKPDGHELHVSIGAVLHPMLPEHYIEWIELVTDQRICRKSLLPGSESKTEFQLNPGEQILRIYSYCNLHGLWVLNL